MHLDSEKHSRDDGTYDDKGYYTGEHKNIPLPKEDAVKEDDE